MTSQKSFIFLEHMIILFLNLESDVSMISHVVVTTVTHQVI